MLGQSAEETSDGRARSRWVRLTDAFLPHPPPADAEMLRRMRTAIGVSYVGIPISTVCALIFYLAFPGVAGEAVAALYAGGALVTLATLFLLRRFGCFRRNVYGVLAYFSFLYLAVGYWMGGPTSPGVYPLLVLPLCALVVMGRAACAVWFGAFCAIHVAFLKLHEAGAIPRFAPTQADLDLLWLVATSVTLLLLAAIVGNSERARREALATLQTSNAELAAARRMADEANQGKTAFLTTMGHEIRTPMSAVLGFADVALEQADAEQLDARDRRALGAVQRNAQALLAILNDMLDLSRIEAGKLEIRPARHKLDELLEQAASLLRAQARARGTELIVERVAGTPDELDTDGLRLQQILVNLLGNAVRSCEEGEVRLVARPLSRAQADWIRFEVQDSGTGMSPTRRAAIARAFARSGPPVGSAYGGAGLGLSISRVLAELLGGEVTVESRAERGSTFRVDLPLDPPRTGAPSTPSPQAPAATAQGPGRLACHVLFVDDLRDNRRLIGHFLERAGARVALAESGADALRQYQAALAAGAPFDVIVLDIQMPDMDGYATRRALRERGCRVPIVALTAHALATERERCLAAGFDDYASKPITRADLIELVARNAARGAAAKPAVAQPQSAAVAERDPRSWLQRGVDALVRIVTPPRLRDDAAALRHARTVCMTALIPLPLMPLETVLGQSVASPGVVALVSLLNLLVMPVCVAALVVYRFTASLALAVHGLAAYFALTVITCTYINGGSESMIALYLAFSVMMATAALGVRAGMQWTLFAVGVNIVFWAVAAAGLGPPDNLVSQDKVAAGTTFSTLLLGAMVTGLGIVQERAKSDALASLASTNCALDDARRRAEQSGLAKSHFLANISHELRTPLTAILAFGDLLAARWRRRRADGLLVESLQTIQRAGSHLLWVINDLLDLAKIESGSLDVEGVEFDPAQRIAETLSRLRPRALEKQLGFDVVLEDTLPGRMLGDPARLDQMLTHLCSNAIKFSESGRIAVTVRAPQRDDGPWLEITVADTGCGIAPEHLARMFTPFEQVDRSTTRRYGGTGLGLALCRRLAELMGGTIRAASQPFAGSCFTLELPLSAVPGSGLTRVLPSEPAEPRASQALREQRLLLAEGSADLRRSLARVLREAGAEVDLVRTGLRVVDCARTALDSGQPHDLVLLDMDTPGVDGAGTARALRDAGVAAPILGLTARSVAERRAECTAAGCDDLVAKPVEPLALIEQIAALSTAPKFPEA
jgi:signal transduction histidine kinase/DNA-binding response OmpR family regulator